MGFLLNLSLVFTFGFIGIYLIISPICISQKLFPVAIVNVVLHFVCYLISTTSSLQ